MHKIFFAVVLTVAAGYLAISKFGNPFAGEPKDGWERKAALETPWRMSQLTSQPNTLANWPPKLNQPIPEVSFFSHKGSSFSMRNLRGKPTIVEFISMSCAGCQAFAGANKLGPYGGLASQPNLESFETYFRRFAGAELYDGDVNYVVVVVYNDKLECPSVEDLTKWQQHFKLDHKNTWIISSPELASGVTFHMIPGFMLLDRNQTVVIDSTGHQPTHNLYKDLLPTVEKMIRR